MNAQRFTKKPVTIEAFQWDGEVYPHHPIMDWCEPARWTPEMPQRIGIETLEGEMRANPGDWIIKGVSGEFYPCKPDIFEATYDKAAE